MSFETEEAKVEYHSNRPPVLTEGKVTPLVVNDFELQALNYFAYKNTPADQQVATIIGSFRDTDQRNWLRPSTERARVMKLSFDEFMTEFREKFLEPDWEQKTRNQLLSSRMSDDQTFDKWASSIVVLQALLIGTSHAIDDTRLRHTLEAGMCADLAYRYNEDKVAPSIPVDQLEKWRREVKRIDEKRIYNLNEQRRIAAEIHKAEKRKATTDGDRSTKKPFSSSSKANTTSAPSTSTSTSEKPKACPRLTDEERTLLNQHQGCNKCRRFYAGHRSNNCPNSFPDPATYRTLTAEDAAAAEKKQQKAAKPVAAVMRKVEDDGDSDDSIESEDSDDIKRS